MGTTLALGNANTGARSSTSSTSTSGGDLPDLNALIVPVNATPSAGGSLSGSVPMSSGASSSVSTSTPPPRTSRGAVTVRLADGTTTEAVEAVAILRDVIGGGLIAQIGDRAYRLPVTATDTPGTEFNRRLNALLRELTPGTTSVSSPVAAPVSPAPATAGSLTPAAYPSVPDISVDDDDALPDMDILTPRPLAGTSVPQPTTPTTSSATPPRVTSAAPAPGDLPRFNLPTTSEPSPRFGRRPKKPSDEPIPEINIAGAIEAYLQHTMSQRPEWQGRSLHITPAPDGGVKIEVDGTFYERVDDVTDADARQFLAATIAEWQSRQ